RGGNAPWHRSHENGRDVDFGFYLLDDDEQPVEPTRFVEVAANGAGSWGGHVRFDDQRNWLLMEALLTDPQAHVKYVFVADTVRARLLREARRRSVAPYLYERARRVTMQPRHVEDHPHANHFHVRIYCAPDDVPDCHDAPPYWPWLPASHPFGG
ncbi:MAG: murein endopeptidase, partial [Polyangiales bacterium]